MTKYLENIRIALDTLRSQKLRSALTLLGVGIGVCVVVAVASLLTGMRTNILGVFEQYGTDNIYVTHLSGFQAAHTNREKHRKPLKAEFARALEEQGDHIEEVAYQGFGPSPTLKYRDRQFTNAGLVGAAPNLAVALGLGLSEGRFLSEIDDRGRRPVCVLGHDVVEALFASESQAVGKTIDVGGRRMTVIGVTEKAKSSFFSIGQGDRGVYIPYRTFRQYYPRAEFLMMIVRAHSGELAPALDETEGILRRLRGLKSNEATDFEVTTFDTIVSAFDAITGTAGLMAIAFAAVGLLVGGIGVMTIMLISVTERTREIGVRKAIGARRRDITFQFLFEAVTLTVMGGIMGVLAAIGVSYAVEFFLPSLPASIPFWAVLAGIAVSVLTGVAFGVFPAAKAARLDPIECLRYE